MFLKGGVFARGKVVFPQSVYICGSLAKVGAIM